jgi:hypothetical protein
LLSIIITFEVGNNNPTPGKLPPYVKTVHIVTAFTDVELVPITAASHNGFNKIIISIILLMQRTLLSRAMLFAPLLFLSACDADEPLVDTGKLVGVWETMYNSSGTFRFFETKVEAEEYVTHLDIQTSNKIPRYRKMWIPDEHGEPIEIEVGSFDIVDFKSDGTEIHYYGLQKEGVYYWTKTDTSTYTLRENIIHGLGIKEDDQSDWNEHTILQLNSSSLILGYYLVNEGWEYGKAGFIGDVSVIWYRRRNSLPEFQLHSSVKEDVSY